MQRPNDANRGPGGFGGPGRGFGGPRSVMPVVKAKNFKGTLRRLWEYFGKERKSLAFVFMLVLGDSALVLLAPYLIGRTIDAISGGKGHVSFGLLGIMALALLISYFTDAFLSFMQGWTMAKVSQKIVQNLRRTLFAKLQKLPVSFFDLKTHGELMSRLSNDVENISGTISQATTQLLTSLIMVSGSFVMMMVLSPLLTLASLITIAMVFTVTKSIAKRTRVLVKEQQVLLGKLTDI
jgi:ATP-binding cassette subfamily B protein